MIYPFIRSYVTSMLDGMLYVRWDAVCSDVEMREANHHISQVLQSSSMDATWHVNAGII